MRYLKLKDFLSHSIFISAGRIPVEEPVTLQWNLDQTEQREVSTLLFARALREDPFNLWINKLTRDYAANIKYCQSHKSYYRHYNCPYRPRGRHIHREGYNCATRYAIKAHSLRVNQVYGHVQFGDLTFYESSYEDFLPITDPLVKPPKKKLNVPFTVSQNQGYYFRTENTPSTWISLVEGKQSIDYLDNNNLSPIWNEHMYYNEIGRLKLEKKLKFARFPPKIIPFPDHPFDTNDYPRLKITFPSYRLNCINGFVCPYDSWTDHYKWHRSRSQKQDCLRYIYSTLKQQWLHFGHKGNYFAQSKFHHVPKTIQDKRDRIKQ